MLLYISQGNLRKLSGLLKQGYARLTGNPDLWYEGQAQYLLGRLQAESAVSSTMAKRLVERLFMTS